MIQVSAATLYGGVSHKNPSERSKVALLTRHGKQFFETKLKRYNEAKKNNCVEFYKNHLKAEQNEINKQLSHFLRDETVARKHKMDDRDPEGWKIWRELSDEYSVLEYFIKKV